MDASKVGIMNTIFIHGVNKIKIAKVVNARGSESIDIEYRDTNDANGKIHLFLESEPSIVCEINGFEKAIREE